MGKLMAPKATFRTRVQVDDNYDWNDLTTEQVFANKRVVLFSLPGAFTPTCTTFQLPGFDAKYGEFKALGIDEVYCASVNDSFVMNAWFRQLQIQNVKPIPDGNADFTRKMGFLVEKKPNGFGERSWRYAMVVNNGEIERIFEEDGFEDNVPVGEDPYVETTPEVVINYIKGGN
jgi:peroxiredoxin